MNLFVNFFFEMLADLVSLLDTTVFSMYGINISVWAISLGGLFISFCISVFWKGAKV